MSHLDTLTNSVDAMESDAAMSSIPPPVESDTFKTPALPPPSLHGYPADIEHIIASGLNAPDPADEPGGGAGMSNYEAVVKALKEKTGLGMAVDSRAQEMGAIEMEMEQGGVIRRGDGGTVEAATLDGGEDSEMKEEEDSEMKGTIPYVLSSFTVNIHQLTLYTLVTDHQTFPPHQTLTARITIQTTKSPQLYGRTHRSSPPPQQPHQL